MFKKVYILMLVILGLSVTYAFLSFLVFISRGKRSKIIKKKLVIGVMLITFNSLFLGGHTSCTPPPVQPDCYAPVPSVEATPLPTPIDTPEPTLDK